MFTVDNDNTDANYYHSLTGTSGTVYVRVTDTDQSQGNRNLDTVFVDYMVIRVDNDEGGDPPDGNPNGLSVTLTDDVNANLSWTDNSSNETGFRVERRIQGGDLVWGTVGETGADGTSFQDTGLAASTTFEYRVFAFNFAGDSALPSNVAEVTTGTPPPPPAIELFVAANKTRAVQTPLLTWNPAATMMDVYLNGGSSALATNVASGWTHETGNKKGGPYTYQVCETGTQVCSDPVTVAY
jgi:hypothetical protein